MNHIISFTISFYFLNSFILNAGADQVIYVRRWMQACGGYFLAGTYNGLDECKSMCSKNVRCGGFNYIPAHNNCYLQTVCNSKRRLLYLDSYRKLSVSWWSKWSSCAAECGKNGSQHRTRSCQAAGSDKTCESSEKRQSKGCINTCGNHCLRKPCRNGVCYQTGANNEYMCVCAEGYTGVNCQSVKTIFSEWSECIGPCMENGRRFRTRICDESSNGCYAYNETRSCLNTCGDYCSQEPCRNGARCESIGNNGFRCDCAHGYRGRFCHRPTCDPGKSCRNGGSCTVTADDDFDCDCFAPFNGKKCLGVEFSNPNFELEKNRCGESTIISSIPIVDNNSFSSCITQCGENEDCLSVSITNEDRLQCNLLSECLYKYPHRHHYLFSKKNLKK